jgi:hypothetical protein
VKTIIEISSHPRLSPMERDAVERDPLSSAMIREALRRHDSLEMQMVRLLRPPVVESPTFEVRL